MNDPKPDSTEGRVRLSHDLPARLYALISMAGDIRAMAIFALLLIAPLIGQVWAIRAVAHSHRITCYVPELSALATLQSTEAP